MARALSTITSAATHLSAPERIDPYWAGMWNLSSSAVWNTRKSIERQVNQGIIRAPRMLERSVDDCLQSIAYGKRANDRQATLAAVNMFRTVTAEQAATLIGSSDVAGRYGKERDALYGSGLISRGVVTTPYKAGDHPFPDVMRPVGDIDTLRPYMPWSKLAAITAGQEWQTGAQADRHNVLITELLLRTAEYCDVPLVTGELLTTVKNMAIRGVDIKGNRAGDGMIVRDDGMRIVVEVTASNTPSITKKIDHWIDVLAADEDRSLAVVFIEACHPDTPTRGNSVRNGLKKYIAERCDNLGMTAVLNSVIDRIMVASWSNWFPAAHEFNSSFIGLECERPTGPRGARWNDVSLLDPYDLTFTTKPEHLAILENAQYLLGVPVWMRPRTIKRIPYKLDPNRT